MSTSYHSRTSFKRNDQVITMLFRLQSTSVSIWLLVCCLSWSRDRAFHYLIFLPILWPLLPIDQWTGWQNLPIRSEIQRCCCVPIGSLIKTICTFIYANVAKSFGSVGHITVLWVTRCQQLRSSWFWSLVGPATLEVIRWWNFWRPDMMQWFWIIYRIQASVSWILFSIQRKNKNCILSSFLLQKLVCWLHSCQCS